MLVGVTWLVFAYLGGISSISGAVVAGTFAPLGITFVIVDRWIGASNGTYQLIAAIGLIMTTIFNPEGIAGAVHERIEAIRARRKPKVGVAAEPAKVTEPAATPARAVSATVAWDPSGAAAAVPVPVATRTLLSTRDVTVRFGTVVAVNQVSIDVGSGRIVGLIGANGAGKTTLIDAISGFVPYTGASTMEDQPLDAFPAYRRSRAGLSRTWQSLELFRDLTVQENLEVASDHPSFVGSMLDLVHPSRAGVRRDTEDALALLDLRSIGDLHPDELTLGQQKLVNVARALVGGPRALLLDEPAAGLSTSETAALGRALRAIIHDDIGILLIEHDVALVFDICDDVYVLDEGASSPRGRLAESVTIPRSSPPTSARGSGRATRCIGCRRRGPGDQRVTGMSTDGAIVLDGLVAGHGRVPAVHGLSLTVGRGEIVALLGPNGAGKTTTLLTIAGALPSLGGTIEVLGARVEKQPAHQIARRGLALVPEDRGLFPHLTVAENLRLRSRRGTPHLAEAVERFPALAAISSRRAGLLSGGQQQMLALACALARHPQVLMIDELSHGLAPIIVEQLLPTVRGLADSGMGVLSGRAARACRTRGRRSSLRPQSGSARARGHRRRCAEATRRARGQLPRRPLRPTGVVMAPRTRLTKDDRRVQILEAARRVFMTLGPRTRVSDIADEAGINVALIYQHFESKDELFATTVVYPIEQIVDRLGMSLSRAAEHRCRAA